MLELGFGNEEREMRFVCRREDKHISKLSMRRPENIGDDKPLTVYDVIKGLGALDRGQDTCPRRT